MLDTRFCNETYHCYHQFLDGIAKSKDQDRQALAWFEQVEDNQDQLDACGVTR